MEIRRASGSERPGGKIFIAALCNPSAANMSLKALVIFALCASCNCRTLLQEDMPTSLEDHFKVVKDKRRSLADTKPPAFMASDLDEFVDVEYIDVARPDNSTANTPSVPAFLPDWISEAAEFPTESQKPELKEHRIVGTNGTYFQYAANSVENGFMCSYGSDGIVTKCVYGADDRTEVTSVAYPFNTKVYLEVWDNSGQTFSCSGTMVGPRHVLTASHCFDFRPSKILARANFRRNGLSSGISYGVRVYRYSVADPNSYTFVDEDYAVVVLEQRLGDRTGWMGVKTYSSSWDFLKVWTCMGYPNDWNKIPVYQKNFWLDQSVLEAPYVYDSSPSRVSMLSTMDNAIGNSGGGAFAYFDNKPHVVAVVSGIGRDVIGRRYNILSGGSAMADLVVRAIREYP